MSVYHAVQRWVLALAILGAAAQPAAAQDAASMLGRRVLSVRLVSEGREVRDPQVETIVEIRRGEPLTMTAVRETIVHVMSMGRFLDVRVDAEPSGDGVAVSLDLVPLRDIRRVVFRGELGVPERVLQAAVTDRFGATPAAGRSADIARTLEETLRDSGYLHATATSRPVGTSDTEAGDLVFEIACGVRARIRSLNYRGSPQPVVSDLQSHLPLREGDAYQPADLRKRLSTYTDALRARGYFEARADPDPRVSAAGDQVDLLITVTQGPLVTVEYAGDPLPPKQRDELVPIAREGSADQDLLEDSELRIRDFLRAQGYRNADATSSRTPEDGRLRIVFTVRRGPLYRVAGVLVEGASEVPEGALVPIVRTTAGRPFIQSVVDADVAALRAEYQRRGFGSAEVTSAAVQVPGEGTVDEIAVTVIFTAVEGSRTTVGDVTLAGVAAIPEAELRSVLETRAGGPVYGPTVDADCERIRNEYLNRGYRLVNVSAAVSYTADRARGTVTFTVREGLQIIVDHILVVGNQRINEATIRHEVVLEPGQPLALDKTMESQRRLAALGLFRRVTISELQHNVERLRDVLITVEEAPTTTIGYGGGVEFQKVETAEFAPRGFFEIGRRNLWGKNRSINFFSRVSLRHHTQSVYDSIDQSYTDVSQNDVEYRVVGSYREPRAFGTSADFLTALAFEQGSRTSFSYRHRSARVDFAQRHGKAWTLLGQYSIQRNDIFDDRINPADRPLIDRLFPQVRIGSVSGSVARDTRNDPIDPSAGGLVGLNGELALRALGSEVGFAKTFLQGFVYRRLPTTRRIVLAGGVRLGLGTGFTRSVEVTGADGLPVLGPDGNPLTVDVRDLPASERFFAGGDTSVRGFRLDMLGRPDTFDSDGTPIGGHAEVILNAEARMALWRDIGVVGFIDVGNVFAYVNDVNFGRLRAGTGFGIRYKSPVGPIRIDFGFKLGTLRVYGTERESRFALHISIGQAF